MRRKKERTAERFLPGPTRITFKSLLVAVRLVLKFGIGGRNAFSNTVVYEDAVEVARKAEELGFNYIWISDHEFNRETYVLITACALNTKKVTLGSGMTNPYTRHPVVTAAAMATCDEVAKGRCVLGIATGNPNQLLKPLGFDTSGRLERLRETIQVVRQAWQGQILNYDGKFLHIHNVKLGFKSRANIPIYIAASNSKTLELCGEVADGVVIISNKHSKIFRNKMEIVLRSAKRSNRDASKIDMVAWIPVMFSKENNAAVPIELKILVANTMQSYTDEDLDQMGIAKDLVASIRNAYRINARKAADLVPDNIVSSFVFMGKPDQIVEEIRLLGNSGAMQANVWVIPQDKERKMELLELFSRSVIRQLSAE